MIVYNDLVYLSMSNGEKLKVNITSQSLIWSVKYGTKGNAIALSVDTTFLLASASFSSTITLGKLSASTGATIS